MAKSIISVIAGYFTMAVLVILTTTIAARLLLGSQDEVTTAYLVVNIALGFLSAIAGGYITAKLAPQNRLRHIYALIAVVIVLGLLSLGQTAGQPTWYPWAIMLVGATGAYAGGNIYERKTANK